MEESDETEWDHSKSNLLDIVSINGYDFDFAQYSKVLPMEVILSMKSSTSSAITFLCIDIVSCSDLSKLAVFNKY